MIEINSFADAVQVFCLYYQEHLSCLQKLTETLKYLTFLKVTLYDGRFSGLLNHANGAKSRKALQMRIISVTFVVYSFLNLH